MAISQRASGRKAAYGASLVKRRRATHDEMEERARFLIDYASEHGPITVRGLYYQAEMRGLPGLDKADTAYANSTPSLGRTCVRAVQ